LVQNVGASAPLVQRAEMALRKDDAETPKEAQIHRKEKTSTNKKRP
jgi:hypothetical protein